MLVILNNKMNFTYKEALNYERKLNNKKYVDKVVVCPSSLYLPIFQGENYSLGSQDVSRFSNGSYTGDISSEQLKSLNVSYCIVGHSERREYHKESNLEINTKINRLLNLKITPILCIGETSNERNNNNFKEVIIKELEEGLKNLTNNQVENVIIAYEPIWAIGTGKIPTNLEIEEAINIIKGYIKGKHLVDNKVLYGGSVNENNYNELKNISNLDGFLIGGLSLKIDKLKGLLN